MSNTTFRNNYIYKHIFTFICSIIFMILSVYLGFYLSSLYSKTGRNHQFPIFIAAWQNLNHYVISSIILKFFNYLKNKKTKKNNNKFNFKLFIKTSPFIKLLPGSLASAIDISLSLISLRNISLFTYTMVKSTSPIFLLFNGNLIGIEKVSIKKFLSVFSIGVGVFMCTYGDGKGDGGAQKDSERAMWVVLCASFVGGFRWAYVGYVLLCDSNTNTNIPNISEKEKNILDQNNITINGINKNIENKKNVKNVVKDLEKNLDPNNKESKNITYNKSTSSFQIINNKNNKNTENNPNTDNSNFKTLINFLIFPLKTINNFSLPTFILLLIISTIFEAPKNLNFHFLDENNNFISTQQILNSTPFIIIYTSSISFIMLLTEFIVIKNSSVMILSVIGIFKEILILAYSIYCGEKMYLVNWIGLIVCFCGVIGFGYSKSLDNIDNDEKELDDIFGLICDKSEGIHENKKYELV